MLTTTTAAVELGISRRRVVALITAGRLKAVKMGRDYIIEDADLDAVRERPQGWPKGKPRKAADSTPGRPAKGTYE